MPYFQSISNNILDMTINNPIFIFSVITVIWFLPGILIRRIAEALKMDKQKKSQAEAIEKLYPKSK